MQRSSDYGKEVILGHPAIGSRVVPRGTCPHPEWSQSAAAPLRGLATNWRRLRFGRKHKRQRRAGEQGGGAQPNPRLEASAR